MRLHIFRIIYASENLMPEFSAAYINPYFLFCFSDSWERSNNRPKAEKNALPIPATTVQKVRKRYVQIHAVIVIFTKDEGSYQCHSSDRAGLYKRFEGNQSSVYPIVLPSCFLRQRKCSECRVSEVWNESNTVKWLNVKFIINLVLLCIKCLYVFMSCACVGHRCVWVDGRYTQR